NPHTKPVVFWERVIAAVNRTDPDVIFLAEAFMVAAHRTTQVSHPPLARSAVAPPWITSNETGMDWATTAGPDITSPRHPGQKPTGGGYAIGLP
ncbi:hypothetical protein ABT382_38290, partial [Streptomyces pharetrae]